MEWKCIWERKTKWALGRTKIKQMSRESKKGGWSKMGGYTVILGPDQFQI
jgi:hypothetical protein